MIFKKAKNYLQNFWKVSLTEKADVFKDGDKVYSMDLSKEELITLAGKILRKKASGMYSFEAALLSTINCSEFLRTVFRNSWDTDDREVKIWEGV